MIKTHRFDGFRFSFIQIARLLKNIFRCCRRLVREFSFFIQNWDTSFDFDTLACR
jgi:hypothetical protein